MKKRKPTAGERMIESARQALAFARGRKNHGCEVHVPDDIDVKAIREKISLSQEEFAKLFGLSKRTLEHWEHGRRVASLTIVATAKENMMSISSHRQKQILCYSSYLCFK
jgi:DNA-binding transcriptional regulator YiaG